MSASRPLISIDTYRTAVPHSGLGQFSIRFAEYATKMGAGEFNFEVFGWNLKEHPLSEYGKAAKWHHRYVRTGRKADLWHSLYQLPSHLPASGTKWLLTIHDLNFLYEKSEAKAAKYLKKLRAEVAGADYLTCISDYTAADVRKHIQVGDKPLEVIHNGVELISFDNPSQPSFVTANRPFFFSIGIFNAKKNFHSLLPLMNRFPNHLLVIAGDSDTSYGVEMKTKIAELGLQDRVILPGKISDSDKFWCYENAEALLFPSIAEGFGMPPIEAMSVGTPVVLSKATSLPEVGGDVAVYFSSFDEADMENAVRIALDKAGAEWSAELKSRAEMFTWEAAMAKYLDYYRRILL